MPALQKPVKAAIIGYGMGAHHASLIQEVDGMEVAMVCDLQQERLEAARRDLGEVKTCTDVAELAADRELDLAVVATPHNAHAECALPCLEAGKHVVVEKPMAITVEECDCMIEAADAAGVSLSVFHNRGCRCRCSTTVAGTGSS
jgi:predicted dehydrogenase